MQVMYTLFLLTSHHSLYSLKVEQIAQLDGAVSHHKNLHFTFPDEKGRAHVIKYKHMKCQEVWVS